MISILATLLAILIPATQAAREAARRAQCANRLKNLGEALMAYAAVHDGTLPGAGGPAAFSPGMSGSLKRTPRAIGAEDAAKGTVEPLKGAKQSWSWAYALLPFLEMENRYRNGDSAAVVASHVPYLTCPTRNRGTRVSVTGEPIGLSDYVGNACSQCDPAEGSGQDGVFLQTLLHGDKGLLSVARMPRNLDQITDGLTNTVCVTEKRLLAAEQPCNDSLGWPAGVPIRRDGVTLGMDTLFSGIEGAPAGDETDAAVQCTSRAGGPHSGGANVLYCDGRVAYKSFGIDSAVWKATLSASNREDVDVQNDVLVSR